MTLRLIGDDCYHRFFDADAWEEQKQYFRDYELRRAFEILKDEAVDIVHEKLLDVHSTVAKSLRFFVEIENLPKRFRNAPPLLANRIGVKLPTS